MRGVRWIQQQAFPRHRAMARRPKRCLVEVDGSSGLVFLPKALPMARVIRMVSLARPPRVSATSGMKSIPTEPSISSAHAHYAYNSTDQQQPSMTLWYIIHNCKNESHFHRIIVGQPPPKHLLDIWHKIA